MRAGPRNARALCVSIALLWVAASSEAAAAPSIEITSVPPYAVDGFISGTVSGVAFASHHVAVYIQIEGSGWWTKPTLATPTVPIAPDGSFTADVVSGGLDDRATLLCAALLPDSVAPPPAEGAGRIPASLAPLALDCESRYSRTISFAGRSWAVKEAPLPVGPGANRFSDRTEDVFVDAAGLHLRLAFHDGFWWSSEVILLESLGYGTYSFQTSSEVDALDVAATFGGFSWDPYGDDVHVPGAAHREIDFEDGRWGNPGDPDDAQMVVQPYTVAGNLHRYELPDLSSDPALTRFFRWESGRVEFVALQGHHTPTSFSETDVIDRFVYLEDAGSSHFVPTAGREAFRFNLWLNGGAQAPAGGQTIEVIIRDFAFTPLSASLPSASPAALLLLAMALLATALLGWLRWSTVSARQPPTEDLP